MTIRRVSMIAFLLLGVAVLVPHLWPDETLSPDAQRLLDTPRALSSDPRALAIGLFGFEAPAGEDIWAHGQFRVSAYNTLGELPEPAAARVSFTVQTNDFCRLRDKDCFEKSLAALPELPALLAAQAEPLARYEALHEARDFGEVLPASFMAPLPPYSSLSVGSRLTLRRALLAFESGDSASAWRTLERELAFHRRMVAGGGSLINKMIALAMVEDEVRLYAALMDREAQRGRSSLPTTAPTRLTLPERSMVEAMDWEAAVMLNLLGRTGDRATLAMLLGADDAAFVHRMLPYKRNATVNRALTPILALARDSLLSSRDLMARPAKTSDPTPTALDWYLNGAGSMLLSYTADFDQYLIRVHDLDALIVLCQVAHRLHTERVTADQVNAVLAAMPEALRNPFDGKTAQWQDGVLRFDTSTHEPKTPLTLPLTLTPRAGTP